MTDSAFLRQNKAPSRGAYGLGEKLRSNQLRWVIALGCLLLLPLITVPASAQAQFVLTGAVLLLLLVLSRRRGRRWTVLLMVVSVIVSTRYLWWRLTETLALDNPLQAALSIGLLLAELYGWVVMVLGYMQSAWPLGRKPVPLPEDISVWPVVDVMIPTYNEGLDIVRNTVWAAQAMDWPRDRLRIHLLDDGKRTEFKEFAEEWGVSYIIRPDNKHAKAGNLNHAMTKTDGEFIVIFDCDHIPNRAFLQMTMGGFLTDPRLALVQTPHHFYSPDPLQRNLGAGQRLSGEGLLFYGLVQDGNDLWDAAFFCGSCAILRRSAIEEIGGFAVETVTEDAHTALRLHRHGWHSAYLRMPLAAGLATETLAAHLGQRARWARGMHQIFRVDNPLFGPGLSLVQRACYMNAMMHFFFPLPRIVVLTAPLAYLVLNVNVMVTSAATVLGYALPHLLLAVAANHRIQKKYRSLFWGEVYETVLAFQLVLPTIVTLLNPSKGKFNVTEKGGLLGFGFFDRRAVMPQLLTILLLLIGYAYGLNRYLQADLEKGEVGVLLINMFWASFNIMILAAAAAVGIEKRQARRHVRIDLELPLMLHLANGKSYPATSLDISMGGIRMKMADQPPPAGTPVVLEMELRGAPLLLPAHVVSDQPHSIRVAFHELSMEQKRLLVLATFGRADIWLDWDRTQTTGLIGSLHRILISAIGLVKHWWQRLRSRPTPAPVSLPPSLAAPAAMPMAGLPPMTETPMEKPRLRIVRPTVAILALLCAGTALLPAPPARGQESSVTGTPAIAPSITTRYQTLQLGTLAGGEGALTMRGVLDRRSIAFSIRRDEVATAAALTLRLGNSPSLMKNISHLKVSLNDELLGSVALGPDTADGHVLELPINPLLLQADNRLGLEFVGHYTTDCEDPLHSALWAAVNPSSTLRLSLQRLPVAPDLAQLPRPFFDDKDVGALTLPFVLGAQPGTGVLRAAGIVASWLGMEADYRPAHFPVHSDDLPDDNAILVATPASKPTGLDLGPIDGPTLAVIPNPMSPGKRLLLVLGRNDEELRAAALTLALGGAGLSGERAAARQPLLMPRQPYDAPRWLPTGRKVRLGELLPPDQLQSNGLQPAPVSLSFNMAPDLFVWRNRGVPVDVRFRYPGGAWLDLKQSRLDVTLNNTYITSLKLREDWLTDWFRTSLLDDYQRRDRPVQLPPYLFYGRNRLEFYYNLYPVDRGTCQPTVPNNLRTGIDADTEIDLTDVKHFTPMPNLAHVATAGFPFTRLADLSETTIVLPDQPKAGEVEAFLDFLALTGSATGYPATQFQIRPSGTGDDMLARQDLVVIGDFSRQPLLQRWGAHAPLRQSGDTITLNTVSPLYRLYTMLDEVPVGGSNGTAEEAERALVVRGGDLAVLMGFQSPVTAGRSVVAFTGTSEAMLSRLVGALRQEDLAKKVQGDLVILNGGDLRSFQVGPRYWVGSLDVLTRLQWMASQHHGLVLLLGLLAIGLITIPTIILLRRRAARRVAQGAGEEMSDE
ncbi:UDP-forming cellulose synthase catalytic subunit [Niveispirillum irakense]|uniref:UDP-forming cellulose synthase catalytic subunit n=1 Tax=Niveispirillum irakense TaxID=34011 RepID=UPI000408C1CF|nr:UDP-forming cellulose synthase catalytic subunit [Niveispirillum irakense]